MADFAEDQRRAPRRFPEDDKERACYQYLLALMQASPDYRRFTRAELNRFTKAELRKYCRREFGVTRGSFDEYCWPEAIKASGANWDEPGRRPCR